MPSRIVAIILPLALAATSATSMAAPPPEDEMPVDARLEGYQLDGGSGQLVIKPPAGSAGTWLMTVAMGVLCVGVMCKNGNRSHLD